MCRQKTTRAVSEIMKGYLHISLEKSFDWEWDYPPACTFLSGILKLCELHQYTATPL